MESNINDVVDRIREKNLEREIMFKMANVMPDREFREMVALARVRGEDAIANVFETLRR
jgi:hypothetical protein